MLSGSVRSDSATPWTVAHQAPLFRGFCRHSAGDSVQETLVDCCLGPSTFLLFFFCPSLGLVSHCFLVQLPLLSLAPGSTLCFSGRRSTDCKNTFNMVPNYIFNKLCLHPLPPPTFLQNSGFSESPETCNPHESWSSKQLMLSSSIMSDSCDPMDWSELPLPSPGIQGHTVNLTPESRPPRAPACAVFWDCVDLFIS